MAADDLICMVSLGEKAIFMKLCSTTRFYELKFDVAERMKVPEEALSLVYKSERHPNLTFSVDNEDDLKCMLEYNRNVGCTEIHMLAVVNSAVNKECSSSEINQKVIGGISDASLNEEYCHPPSGGNASNSERIPTDCPSGENVVRADDIISKTYSIPDCWHTALTGKGQQFETAIDLRLALQYYSMAKKFDYDFVKNEPKRIRVICRYKEMYVCPWMLFASPVKNKKRIEIKRFVNEHSCGQHTSLSGQSRASRRFVAEQLRPVLKVRPEIRPKDVQKEFLTRYGLRLEYSKIWWGKERAQEAMYGDSYESYDQLRWYEQKVKETNPGSYICIDQNEGRFKRLFICYAACIVGFLNGCRPLLFLDGTFLKDRYKGLLLSAVAYDGDQGIFPLAYCICDQENVDNWSWFLQGLWSILYERPDPYNPPHQLVIISDADKGIQEAVREYFPEAIHSRCVLHLVENFRSKLKDLGMKAKDTHVLGNLLQSACYKYTVAEWNDYMKDIYEMSPAAYEIVNNYSPEHWANAFFPGIRYCPQSFLVNIPFCRYGHVTSNVAESFNSWIREARMLRILQMVEHIRKQIMTRMNNRRIMAEKWTSYLCPKAEQIVGEHMERGSTLEIKQSRDDIFEVQSQRTTHVDLGKRTCTCRAWDLTRIPCVYACAVIIYMKREVYQYCDWFMSVEAFKKSYDEILYPIPDYEMRSVPKDEIQILPPITTKRRGRNRTRRINNITIMKRPVKCGRCKSEGHNRATCNEPIHD
ncbi:uncharacterized protein LOC109841498 [Asparagus officinalis]|uniref:uncharacterized protein LOC109841498 n=1 Tax=Asparagus officinalis TaxID=4686 RepID=UPI00098E0A7F|nr:uncharacterized protein LOC109841498 [Asparagus officinalis]